MRIAHVVIGGEVAGGQAIAHRLLRGARGHGYDVLVVSPTTGDFVHLLEREGVPVRLLPLGRSFDLRRAVSLARLLREERVDLLHTHTALAANVLGRVAGQIAQVPVVAHMHIENHLRSDRVGRALQTALDNLTARFCARILVVSDETRRALERQGYPPNLMQTIHNGIDLRTLDEAASGGSLRASLGIPADSPLVGHVGRLCEVKGQRELVEAAARLVLRGSDLRVVFVGKDLETGGAFQRELEARASRLGISDRIVFAGYRHDVPAVLAELDLLALPSWIEGLPLVVLEAMALGKPVVATPVGGTAEAVVDGETGLLVPPGDVAVLADSIEAVLADPARARRLGSAGARRVRERFSDEQMVSEVLRVYDEVLGRS